MRCLWECREIPRLRSASLGMTKSTPANPAAAENNVIVVDDRSLPGCDRALRLMQSNARAILFQWSNRCNCTWMVVANLHRGFEFVLVAAIGDRGAGIIDPGYNVPIHTVDFEFIRDQIVGVADDDTISFGIQIDHVTRTRRTAGKSFPLSDREQLDAVMLTEEISIDVVNFAAMKLVIAQMRKQKRLVIVARNETNLLAVDFVGDL